MQFGIDKRYSRQAIQSHKMAAHIMAHEKPAGEKKPLCRVLQYWLLKQAIRA